MLGVHKPWSQKTDCRLIEKIPKEQWWINKNKPSKKKANAPRAETSDNVTSESEDSSEERIAGKVMLPCSGAHTLGWSRVHSRPKGSVSNVNKCIENAKFAGVHGVRKHPKIKVNHQIYDPILL